MDWRTGGFDWNRARAFLVTAEEGSFSGAARALGMSQPTLGRQVDALEEELGVVLFERVGRGLALTAAGVELLEHVRTMGEAASHVALSASGQSQTLEGSITITASEVNTAFLLPPILERLRREHPAIEVTLVATNEVRDLRKREADIALRSGRPSDPKLVATRLRDTPARLYATPSYLHRIGNPRTARDLANAEFIGFGDTVRFMAGLNAMGFDLTPKNFPIRIANHMVLWELVKSGLGIGAIIEEVGDAEPLVERVLPSLSFPCRHGSLRIVSSTRAGASERPST
ncbi:Transcriptional regulator, LysR family [Labilithrix luteola]|uniref:Transcriptional regulator, LysR family n=1 Tax=Labilithrix luteola TaxID=1391654 RepID=A0A0K1PYS8_9BACT|nr:LysR family transcriptional regulator [Labilithrix luteola]AKU98683.1 Transcriptional regulator, LysR family [Labilithrix luteola]